MFTGDAGEVAFAVSGAIEEFGNNLEQLLSVLGIRDVVVPGAAIAPGFSKNTKHELYVCLGCPHDTYSDKYGEYQEQCFIMYRT